MLLLFEGIPSTRGPVSGYLGSCPINRTPIKNKPLVVQAVRLELEKEWAFRRSTFIVDPTDTQIKRNKKPHLHRKESVLLIGLRPKQHAHALKNLKDKDRAINGNKEANDESAPPGRPPSPPAGELSHVGRPWPSPTDARARLSHGRAPV